MTKTNALMRHDLAVDMFREYVEKELEGKDFPKGDALDDLLDRARKSADKYVDFVLSK